MLTKRVFGQSDIFVSTVGINEAIIRKYIKMQEKEDSGQAKLTI